MIAYFNPLSSEGATTGNLYWPYFTPSPWDDKICIMTTKTIFRGTYSKSGKKWHFIEESHLETTKGVGITSVVTTGGHYTLVVRGNHCLGYWEDTVHNLSGASYLVIMGVNERPTPFLPYFSSPETFPVTRWAGELVHHTIDSMLPCSLLATKMYKSSTYCTGFQEQFLARTGVDVIAAVEAELSINNETYQLFGFLVLLPVDENLLAGALEPYKSAIPPGRRLYYLQLVGRGETESRLEAEVRGNFLFGHFNGLKAFAMKHECEYHCVIADLYK